MSIAYNVVRDFERVIANYAGSKYAVAVESCSAALFLCCKYLKVDKVIIPCHTYPAVPCSIINAGGTVVFENIKWRGAYQLKPWKIYDSATRFKRGMYIRNSYYCLSFHSKKHLNIGRGGMILTNNIDSVDWFRQARFDGRHEKSLMEDDIEMIGWNMYMTPEQASRGLELIQFIKDDNEDLNDEYPDLSKFKCYK